MMDRKVSEQALHEFYYERTLPSGFRIILYPKKGVYTKGAYLHVGYGSVATNFISRDGKQVFHPDGSAHFLEHKLFENDDVDIFSAMSQLGADVNAFTSHENTCYYFTSGEHFMDALELLLQIPLQRAYTEEGILSEMDIISREIDMYLDNVDYFAYHKALEKLYPKHPIGRDIAGSKESIQRVNKVVLDEIMDHFYVPENMFLFVIGDFEKEMLDHVEEKLPDFYRQKKGKATIVYPQDLPTIKHHELRFKKDLLLPSFSYLMKLEPIEDPHWSLRRFVKYSMILQILFGSASDFFREHYERDDISDLDVSYSFGKGYRFISFCAEGKRPEVFLGSLKEGLQRFSERGVHAEEVERMKRKMMGRYLMGFNSIKNIAHNFMMYEAHGLNFYDFMKVAQEIVIDDFKDLFHGETAFCVVEKESI